MKSKSSHKTGLPRKEKNPKTTKKSLVNPPNKKVLEKPQKDKTVYVGNLRYDKNEAGIRVLFSHYGSVKWVKLVLDPKTGRSKGIAFIEMASHQEAQRAIKGLNGKVVENRTLKASMAIQKKESPLPKDKSKSEDSQSRVKSAEKAVSKTGSKKDKERLAPVKKKKGKGGLESLLNYLKK